MLSSRWIGGAANSSFMEIVMPMLSNAIRKRALTVESRAQGDGSNRISSIGAIAALCAGAVVIFAPAVGRAGIIETITGNGYTFTNFDPAPLTGTAVGSNVNGISNTGKVAGTEVDVNNASTFSNFTGTAGSTVPLNTGTGQIAFGINSAGEVVGGNGTTAFFLPNGGSPQTLTTPAGAINAFGINDNGGIVGQFTNATGTPGFYLTSSASNTFVTINAPSGPDVVNAQGIANNGSIVGFYVGTDGQDHGFTANAIPSGSLTGTAVADPVIPSVPGEPGAIFVFSQILGVNDEGIAVGYYGDSTTSQHGFIYDTQKGAYTFLDDPAASFHNGVEVTQITGISDAGEIAGFYTDANGIAHSFTASIAVPEPSTWAMMLLGFAGLGFAGWRARGGFRLAA
jgi:hypothetical protein